MTNCLIHTDRETTEQLCITVVRDRRNYAHGVCVCCEECRQECLSHPPHNHGGDIDDEWDRNDPTSLTGIRCKICGIEIL